MGNLDHFIVNTKELISDALTKIEKNGHNIIFVCDSGQQIVGVATDGDIRRALLKGETLKSCIEQCMNTSFVSATDEASREYVLKLLDHRVNIVPILNKEKNVVGIVSRKEFPLDKERGVVVRAKSPVRISFGGGGTDLTHYFVENGGGAVLNATVQIYSHASLSKRADGKIRIESHDLRKTVELNSLDELSKNSEFELIYSLLKLIKPEFGFDLSIHSDFPMGSGLGGSAAVLSAIIGCFNQFREDAWDRHEVAELAFQAERLFFNMAGGWQDQYATVFGGFNFMEFREDQNVVYPLKVDRETILELQGNLLLCDTEVAHVSGNIHDDQKKTFESQTNVRELVHQNLLLTYKLKSHLLRGRLTDFGKTLGEAWMLKRQFSDKISNISLDNIYDRAVSVGALGGKLLGAGGGGFFLFYVQPENRFRMIHELEALGLKTRNVLFESEGLQSWKVRKNTCDFL